MMNISPILTLLLDQFLMFLSRSPMDKLEEAKLAWGGH